MTETKRMEIIPAGSTFTITSGEYSDYYVRGVFRALKDIDGDALMAEWLAADPARAKRYCFNDSAFLGWVAAQGFLEDVPGFEWHLDGTDMTIEKDAA